jgi:hypothetical protein
MVEDTIGKWEEKVGQGNESCFNMHKMFNGSHDLLNINLLLKEKLFKSYLCLETLNIYGAHS